MDRLPLGAPGIYVSPQTPLRKLTGQRMDVCAFAGVAPRGPVRVPVVDEKWRDDVPCVEPDRPRRHSVAVPIDSWADYVRVFGGFEGPGRLPYAVAAFFDNGGRRAWVIRIVHDYGEPALDAAGVAQGVVPGVTSASGDGLLLRARSEGAWGNRLRGALAFAAEPFEMLSTTPGELTLPRSLELPAGSLVRLTLPGGVRVLRFVTQVFDHGTDQRPFWVRRATLDLATALPALSAEVVTATLTLDDGDGRRERHQALGLSPQHPRFIGRALCWESELVYPAYAWTGDTLSPGDAALRPGSLSEPFSGGEDRVAAIVPEDFFDDQWLPDDDVQPRRGVHAIAENDEVALLVAPDLYSPGPLVEVESVVGQPEFASPEFVRCTAGAGAPPVQAAPVQELEGLLLDPEHAADLARIVGLQRRLIEFAEQVRNFVVLLDVPPKLRQRAMLAWRAQLDSSWAAAYHPFIRVARVDDRRDALVRVNPSAIAAGIIAQRETLFGVQHGPANAYVSYAVDVDDRVSPARHDELHQSAINVFLRERDGILLTAGRTLSRDPDYRQLSVRRLMTMLRRVIEQQLQWTAFEPNNARLRANVRNLIAGLLRDLYRANAFTGATEAEAYFVRCDEALNPPQSVDAGRLVCEVGVAPAEPLEFLVLRITRDGDRVLSAEQPS